MVDSISTVLAGQQYRRIPSNIPYVTLYAFYEGSSARLIQLIDCEKEILLTAPQYVAFCKRAREFAQEKGYTEVELLSVVVTPYTREAKKYALSEDDCWIVDSGNNRLIIYDHERGDFYGLRAALESILYTEPSSAAAKSPEEVRSDWEIEYYKEHYGPGKSQGSPESFREEFTLVNTIMVVINVIVFIIASIIGDTQDARFMISHGAMYVPAIINDHEFYRFFTCMFMHFGFMHLVGNMVVMLFLGDNVERAVGKIKYLLIYLGGGLIGSIGSFTYAYMHNDQIVSAGASGAIFALIGALLLLVIRNRGKLENMTTLRVTVLIAYALYSGFTSENIDMAAHLFGLLGGFLIALLVYRKVENT